MQRERLSGKTERHGIKKKKKKERKVGSFENMGSGIKLGRMNMMKFTIIRRGTKKRRNDLSTKQSRRWRGRMHQYMNAPVHGQAEAEKERSH